MILIRSFLLSKSRKPRLRHPLVPLLWEDFGEIPISPYYTMMGILGFSQNRIFDFRFWDDFQIFPKKYFFDENFSNIFQKKRFFKNFKIIFLHDEKIFFINFFLRSGIQLYFRFSMFPQVTGPEKPSIRHLLRFFPQIATKSC